MDLFKFPFHVDVWGTVSDWAAVIVYGITGYLIYKTLKSQVKVQEVQNDLLKIEQLRLREQFKPAIGYYEFLDSTKERYIHKMKKDSEFLSISAKNISDNAAINYDFFTPQNSQAESVEKFFSQPSLIKGENASIHFIVKNIKPKNPISYQFTFYFFYSDLIGNRYTQRVFCQKKNSEVIIRSHIPEIVKVT